MILKKTEVTIPREKWDLGQSAHFSSKKCFKSAAYGNKGGIARNILTLKLGEFRARHYFIPKEIVHFFQKNPFFMPSLPLPFISQKSTPPSIRL